MCLLFFAYKSHPYYRFILAANRDEFYRRPTESAHFWKSHPWILAGRDLEMMGTWMGITKSGRFAALTNFRDPASQIMNAKSRGFLVSDFLCTEVPPQQYMLEVAHTQTLYNPFNLLVGDSSNLYYFSNQTAGIKELKPGIYGLSNHFLDTPWPKVRQSKQALANYLERMNDGPIDSEVLFEMLAKTEQAHDYELPSTGLSPAREKMLSSIFIPGADYGTRSSTVLCIDRQNHVFFQERSFNSEQGHRVEVNYEFTLVQ